MYTQRKIVKNICFCLPRFHIKCIVLLPYNSFIPEGCTPSLGTDKVSQVVIDIN